MQRVSEVRIGGKEDREVEVDRGQMGQGLEIHILERGQRVPSCLSVMFK